MPITPIMKKIVATACTDFPRFFKKKEGSFAPPCYSGKKEEADPVFGPQKSWFSQTKGEVINSFLLFSFFCGESWGGREGVNFSAASNFLSFLSGPILVLGGGRIRGKRKSMASH